MFGHIIKDAATTMLEKDTNENHLIRDAIYIILVQIIPLTI